MESPLPGSKTEFRRLRLPERDGVACGNAPALPEAPPLIPEPPRPSAPLKPPEDAPAAVPSSGKAAGESALTSCPRCQGKLVDTAGLGWCPGCGYCHSLEQDRANVPVPTPVVQRKKDPGVGDFAALLIRLPFWVWIMVVGIATVAAVTGLLSQSLRPAPFPRCIWCTLQIVVGALVLLLASFWALLQVASEDENMTAKDVFLPARLWGLACKRLPKTSMPLCLAVWGVTAILSAAVLVGGLSEWLKHLPKSSAAAREAPSVSRPV